VGLQTFAEQTVALMHTEAVLLIHHHKAEAGEHHRVLQQRMGAH